MRDIHDAQAGGLCLMRNKEDATAVRTLLNRQSLAPISVSIKIFVANQHHIFLFNLLLSIGCHYEIGSSENGRKSDSEQQNKFAHGNLSPIRRLLEKPAFPHGQEESLEIDPYTVIACK
jgi:hypothetical protein